MKCEDYATAGRLRDEGGLGLAGWWQARSDADPCGHLLRVSPDFGRLSGLMYTSRDLAELKAWPVSAAVSRVVGVIGAGARVRDANPCSHLLCLSFDSAAACTPRVPWPSSRGGLCYCRCLHVTLTTPPPPPPQRLSNVLRLSGYGCTVRAFAEFEAWPWLRNMFPHGHVTVLLVSS